MTRRCQYRAQANGVNGWVDGGLFTRRARAEADAERLARQYGVPTRVVEVPPEPEQDRLNWGIPDDGDLDIWGPDE